MSQRHLAWQSGVDHSTISRLIRDDRVPSLGTAAKLAQGLREIHDESEALAYFAAQSEDHVSPAARVEDALRADHALAEVDVRDLMRTFRRLRRRAGTRGEGRHGTRGAG